MSSPLTVSPFSYNDIPGGGSPAIIIVDAQEPLVTNYIPSVSTFWLSPLPQGTGRLFILNGFINGVPNWVLVSGPSGDVVQVVGTPNQVNVTTASGIATVSIPSTFIAPGSIVASTGLTVTTGDARVSDGDLLVNNGDLVIAQGDVFMTFGNIQLVQGDITLNQGDLTLDLGSITLSAGNIELSSGSIAITNGDINIATGDITLMGGDVTAINLVAADAVQFDNCILQADTDSPWIFAFDGAVSRLNMGFFTSGTMDFTTNSVALLINQDSTRRFYITSVVVRLQSQTNLTVPPEFSFGIAPSYNSVIPNLTVPSAWATTGGSIAVVVPDLQDDLLPAQDLYVQVTTPATAIACNGVVEIIGYWYNF